MQITIQLDDKARRPIANISWFNGCRALIDTGALFPIWNGDGKSLEDGFDAKLQKRNIVFSGFGGKAKGDLYRVNFVLNGIYYMDMPIIASELEGTNWNMIISATMFDGMTYEIDTINKKLNIDTKDNQPVRILKLSDDNNNISVYLAETYQTKENYLKEQ
ncbi:MAG: hypothetical protein NC313_02635 [Butyrivibrio sp.]|nr:hypothetical protein [Butyrivibrio sp.]